MEASTRNERHSQPRRGALRLWVGFSKSALSRDQCISNKRNSMELSLDVKCIRQYVNLLLCAISFQ